MCIYVFIFPIFKEHSIYSLFIARTTNCFDELNSSLLLENAPNYAIDTSDYCV